VTRNTCYFILSCLKGAPIVPGRPTYRTAFVSHAHADNAQCARIAELLRAKGIDLWIDLTNLQTGHALTAEITRSLVRRQAFVLLVTPAADASPWVGNELDTYLAYSLDRSMWTVGGQQRLIIPVRLSPVTIQPDAEVSNWAKVFGRKWIDGVGKPDEVVANEIAVALQTSVSDWEEIGIHARLYHLGFRGWRVRATGVEFILPPTCDVSEGSFLMGSDMEDEEAFDNEKPQYRIPLGAFAIGKYPVTVAEYACAIKAGCVKEPPCIENDEWTWEKQQRRPDHPVTRVFWGYAKAYATWLADTTGQPWRLPSEAEWEKAARWDEGQQHSRIYPWGDQWDAARANADWMVGNTTAVGSYPTGASAVGALDMAGNVDEWTSSIWKDEPPYDRSACEGDGIRDERETQLQWMDRIRRRVARGGAWYSGHRSARTAYRRDGNGSDTIIGPWMISKDDYKRPRGFRLALG